MGSGKILGGAILAAFLLSPSPLGAQEPLASDALHRLKSRNAEERAQAARELGATGNMDHTPPLASLMRDKNPLVRGSAHDALWRIWMRSGDHKVDALMAQGVRWMNAGNLEKAIKTFGAIIRRKPDFAEGWNKRATAYYLAKRYRESIKDCQKALKLNPYHFGALFGIGLNQLGLRDLDAALEAFRRTQKLLPYSREAAHFIEAIEAILARKRTPI